MLGAAAITGVIFTSACASDAEGSYLVGPSWGTPQTATVTGDWDDVDAAVETAAGQSEMAELLVEAVSDRERVYTLRTIRDETAKLVVRRGPGAGVNGVPIQLEARVGAFGDASQEQRLLRAMTRRLEDLKGVDFAPVHAPSGT